MLADIIRQLAQEFGVPIIINEKAEIGAGDFDIEIAISRAMPPGTLLIVSTGAAPLWLTGLAEEGQSLLVKSPELKYIRIEGEELKDKR